MNRAVPLALAASLLWIAPAVAQALPLVDEVEWGPFRQHCRLLLEGLRKLDAPLPAETARGVEKLLEEKAPGNPRQAVRGVQKLLDGHCLVGVNINPESRVK